MNIPSKAVNAATQALREAFDTGVDTFEGQARAALEAAATFIAERAWDEGFKFAGPMRDHNYDERFLPDNYGNPYGSGTETVPEHLRGSDNATTVRAMLAKLNRSGT